MKNIYKILLFIVTAPMYAQNFGIRIDESRLLGPLEAGQVNLQITGKDELNFPISKPSEIHYFPATLGTHFLLDFYVTNRHLGYLGHLGTGDIPIEPDTLYTIFHVRKEQDCGPNDLITAPPDLNSYVCTHISKLKEEKENKELKKEQEKE